MLIRAIGRDLRVYDRFCPTNLCVRAATIVRAMRVVITGGFGFLGRLVAESVLQRGLVGYSGAVEPVTELVLYDQAGVVPTGSVLAPLDDARVHAIEGDICDADLLTRALANAASVFHLASVVSAEAEVDFEKALRVNLDGSRTVLEACRTLSEMTGRKPRFIFTSSVAVFGGEETNAGPLGDTVKQTPESTYGMTKAMGELLVNDFTRRGWVDGRSARLPTVIIRPGKPNLAASSFASGLFREPLAGDEAVIPVTLDTPMVVVGYRTAVAGLLALHDLDSTVLGLDRCVGIPALEVTVGQMVSSLQVHAEATGRALGPIRMQPDPSVMAIVDSWPGQWDHRRAHALGLPAASSLSDIIDDFLMDFGPPASGGLQGRSGDSD